MNDLPRTAAAVVIGGGVVGTSIAYWLTQRGVRDVVLLEKNALATGATGKSAGLVRRHYTNRWDAALAQESWSFFQQWGDLIGGECGFVKTGFLMLVRPQYAENLRRNVEMHVSLGAVSRMLTPAEVRELEPSISLDGVGAAAYEPDSGYADPTSVATGFARRAGELGARVYQGVEVSGVLLSGGRVQGVQTTRGTIAAPTVVLACGPWSPAFARRLGIELPVRVKRVIEVYVRRPPGLRHMTVIDEVSGTYFRPEGSDVTLLGGRSNDWGTDPDDYDGVAGPEIVEPAIERAVERLPTLARAGLMRGIAGVDGYSDDFHQILGRAPGVDGLFLAAGGSGTAFKKSPAIGKCMAELILDGQARTVDLHPFRLERFAEDAPVRGEYEYSVLEGLGSRLV